MSPPKVTRALVVAAAGPSGPTYTIEGVVNDAKIETRPIPALKPNQVLVKMTAVAFNHRELWILKNLYPGIKLGSVMGADGAGIVVQSAQNKDPLLGKRVFLTPMRGWESDPEGPEDIRNFGVVGGVRTPDYGVFSEYVVIDRDQVILTPPHLTDVQTAAWPVAGITAWRAAKIHGNIQKGQNVLITGIGGGVALVAMQLCIALGANVYVTSGDEAKIAKAVELGAKGGVSYKNETWEKDLSAILSKTQRPYLDVVIDSGGGDITPRMIRILKAGGIIVCYGMATEEPIPFTMREVMKNIQLKGSMMGSHKELREATAFMAKHKVEPVVSHVLDGLENAEEGFKLIDSGKQFGKVVIQIRQDKAKL